MKKYFLVLSLFSALASHDAYAQNTAKWEGHIDTEGKWGSDRSLGEITIFTPLWQDDDTLFFSDIRGKLDNQDSQEFNIGFGYRQQVDNKYILGGYGFYDHRKTDNDNTFNQLTIGAEILTPNYEARINGYVPEKTEKSARGANAATASIVGGSFQIETTGALSERALSGFDVEVGRRFELPKDWTFWAYAGGFHFDADGYENVSGPRVRAELSKENVPYMPYGSRFTVGVEAQTDDVRDEQIFGIARLRIPFSAFNGRHVDRAAFTAMDKRMTDRIVRDVDIVAGEKAVTKTQTGFVTSNAGVTTSSITQMDATDDLSDTVAAAGTNTVIVIDGSAGNVTDTATVNPLQGQYIVGGGTVVNVSSASGVSASLTLPGTRPTITTTPNIVFNVTNNDVAFEGFNVDGGLSVISANNNFMDDISVSNSTGNGILFDTGAISTLRNATITNSGVDGLALFNNSNVTARNINIVSSQNSGAFIETGSSFDIADSLIDTTNVNDGINSINASATTLTVNNVEFRNMAESALDVTNDMLSGSGNTVTISAGAGACADGGGNTGSIAFSDVLGGGAATCP